MEPSGAPHGRVRLFDTLRGFSVISMVLFHFYYDLVFLIGIVPTTAFFVPAVDIWRASISWTFLVIAGAMCTFSRNNFKRAGVYLAVALAVYLVTSFIGKDVEISFGIIYCMGACTLIAAVLSHVGFKPDGLGWVALFFAIFLLLLDISHGSISIFGIHLLDVPRSLYLFGGLSWLGFPGIDFVSADYYPILPYLFLYLTGWSLGIYWGKRGYSAPIWRFSIEPLEIVGRYALPIYVLHQPVLLGISQLIFYAIGR